MQRLQPLLEEKEIKKRLRFSHSNFVEKLLRFLVLFPRFIFVRPSLVQVVSTYTFTGYRRSDPGG